MRKAEKKWARRLTQEGNRAELEGKNNKRASFTSLDSTVLSSFPSFFFSASLSEISRGLQSVCLRVCIFIYVIPSFCFLSSYACVALACVCRTWYSGSVGDAGPARLTTGKCSRSTLSPQLVRFKVELRRLPPTPLSKLPLEFSFVPVLAAFARILLTYSFFSLFSFFFFIPSHP